MANINNKQNYKLIALDLDGTLLDDNKKISSLNKKALIDAQENGIKVVLASGRTCSSIEFYAKDLQIDKYNGYIVALNGAKIYDLNTKKTVFEKFLTITEIKLIQDVARELNLNILTYLNEELYATNINCEHTQYESFICNKEIHFCSDFTTLPSKLSKIIILGSKGELDNFPREYLLKFKNKVHVARSNSVFLEIMPLSINKGNALVKISELTNIKLEEMIACGDNYNDLEMIEIVGLGCAVKNAVASLKDISSFITKTNNEDAIAYIISNFILNK